MPILTNVHIGGGRVVATNLEIWIAVDVPELEGDGFVLPHKALTEALKFTPGRQQLTLTDEGNNVTLTTSGSQLNLVKPGLASDFPPVPSLARRRSGTRHRAGEGHAVDGDKLVAGFTAVVPYASKDRSRPILTGVGVRLTEDLEMVGADGFRLAIQRPGIHLTGEASGEMVVVPT